MTVHCCRDLFLGSGSVGNMTGALHSMHAMAVFMQGVLGYTYHSRAGNLTPPTGSSVSFNYYDYNGSTYTYLSQSTWPYRSASILIGMGVGRENWVQLSRDMVNMLSAAYPVNVSTSSSPWQGSSGGDPFTNKLLAIKSDTYPLANSGIFLITSTSLADNALIIDYRSTTSPFIQTSSYVSASLWPAPTTDANTTIAALATNGSGSGYQTSGVATYPRMILTSPSSDAWQVRLCIEGSNDRSAAGASSTALSAAPGYSGSNGDYPTGSFRTKSQHLHAGQWLNIQTAATSTYNGLTPGLDRLQYGSLARRQRMFMWGDDQTGTTLACIRNSANVNDTFIAFGEAESPETVSYPINKLFVIGQTQYQAGIDWRCGNYNDDGITGLAYSLDHRMGPISCTVSPYVHMIQTTVSGSIWQDSIAGDTPFLSGSELVPVDLIAGTLPQLVSSVVTSQPQILNIEPRRLGRFPFARLGRCKGTNATGSWYAVTPNLDWFHVECGIYLPWGGVASLT